jgi:carbon monoxide dehydrogenase subunit G
MLIELEVVGKVQRLVRRLVRRLVQRLVQRLVRQHSAQELRLRR